MSVWNRLQTAANSTTTLIQTPAELLPQNKQRRHRRRAADDPQADDPDKRFWQESFDQRLDGLEAPTTAPYRYEVHRGKTVPSPSDRPSGSKDYLPGLETLNAAPRNPPPRQRRQFQSDSGWDVDAGDHDNFRAHGRHESERSPADSREDHYTFESIGKMQARGPRGRWTDAQGVSPPSSPEVGATRAGHTDHDVSPIDDEAGMSQQQLLKGPRSTQRSHQTAPHLSQPRGLHPQADARQPSGQHQKSSIPTMRRERRRQQDASLSAPRSRPNVTETGRETPPIGASQNAVGWDEPVGARGRPVHEPSHDDSQLYGMTTTITSSFARQSKNPSPSLGQRVRQQLGRGSRPESIDTRPAWNGASGRQTIVSPVQDNPNVAPLNVPPKSSKRAGRESQVRGNTVPQPHQSSSETPKGSSAAAAMRKLIPSRSGHTPEPHGRVSPVAEPATRNVGTPTPSHPSPLQTASPAVGTQATDFQPQNSTPSALGLTIPDSDKAIKRKPPPSSQASTPQAPSHGVHPSTSSSVYSVQPGGNFAESPVTISQSTPRNQAPDDGWVQPASRFSISTFATSNAYSPRQSADEERPPLPEPPAQSVMDRRRPLRGQESPNESDDPVVISLKSANISSPIGLGIDKHNTPRNMANAKASRPSSILSTSKELPPAPPEMVETKDRVVLLNTKIAALTHRKNNVIKSIKQMTELMPADKLMESAEVLRKREDEKKKVEILKAELAEIQQQEYDLGLKLHRAYKRQEREASYESGTLWVRRVTS